MQEPLRSAPRAAVVSWASLEPTRKRMSNHSSRIAETSHDSRSVPNTVTPQVEAVGERAAALIGFMSGDVYWSPSIECADLRGRGKRHENAVKKSPKKLGEEEGDLGRDGGGIKISSAPSFSPCLVSPRVPPPLRRRWSILYLGQKLRAR